jgi:hypothetical protein
MLMWYSILGSRQGSESCYTTFLKLSAAAYWPERMLMPFSFLWVTRFLPSCRTRKVNANADNMAKGVGAQSYD